MSWNRTIDRENPCQKDCPDRSPTCHATCEKHKEWLKKHQEKKERIRKEFEKVDTISHAAVRAMWRKQRYSNQATKHHSSVD